MKTKITISILCLCSIFMAQAQEWGYVNTLTDEWLRKICTQGLDTVYIVGENGLIARSIDQGETWEKQYFPTQVALNDIIFIDYYTGFAVGEQGTILRTADAGENWSQVSSGTTSHINAIAATGLDNIWAVGDNSLILHSTDAGENWEQVNILPENNRQLLDIAFRGNLGYFTGNYASVYKTNDQGGTWEKQTVLAYSDEYCDFYSLNVMEHTTYMFSQWERKLFSIKENEQNWVVYNNLPMDDGFFYFRNDSVGYCISYLPISTCCSSIKPHFSIDKTVNNASNWIYEWSGDCESKYLINNLDIKFVNDTIGYAIAGGTLVKTPMPAVDPPEPQSIIDIGNTKQVVTFYQEANNLIIVSPYNTISVELLDVQGKYLRKHFTDDYHSQAKINIADLPKGIYLIKVNLSDNDVYIKKWIKH